MGEGFNHLHTNTGTYSRGTNFAIQGWSLSPSAKIRYLCVEFISRSIIILIVHHHDLTTNMLHDFRVPVHVYSCPMKNIATTSTSVWHNKAKISPVKTEVKASGMQ